MPVNPSVQLHSYATSVVQLSMHTPPFWQTSTPRHGSLRLQSIPHLPGSHRHLERRKQKVTLIVRIQINSNSTHLNDPLVFIQDPRPPHMILPTTHSSMSFSQFSPSNPVPAQSHWYSPTISMHFPCSHGLEAHSSISDSQYFPVNPKLH